MKEQTPKKVLLLGGTGAMGAHLAKVLSSQGNKVDVTTRRERKDAWNVHYIQGNAHDTAFVDRLLEQGDYDAVIDFMVYNTAEFKARADMMLSGTRQYVFLSSSRVYADSKSPIKEDETPRLLDVCKDPEYLATDEYALAKARQEDVLRDSGKKNWTIIRPYITYSEIRLQLGVLEKEQWLWRALHGRTIVFSKDIAEKFTTLTYGLNVAEAMSAVIGKPEAYGEAFHITCGTSCRWSEILDVYLDTLEEVLGRRPKVLMLDEALNLRNGGKWQVKVDRLFNRRFDNEKINRFYDTSRFLSTKDGLKQCLKEFANNQSYNGINIRREAYYDRLTCEWAKPTDFPSFKRYVKYMILRTIYPKNKLI